MSWKNTIKKERTKRFKEQQDRLDFAAEQMKRRQEAKREKELTFDMERAQRAYDDVVLHVNRRLRWHDMVHMSSMNNLYRIDMALQDVKTNEDMKAWIQRFKMEVAGLWANDYFEYPQTDVDTWLRRNGFMK